MKRIPLFLLLLTVLAGTTMAQKTVYQPSRLSDSLSRHGLDEVVVTATRNERKLGNVAVPVSVISQKTIQRAGSVRLRDILQEQTGLFLTSGFGAGVQMQGLNPDYTLILVDGEPLVGRTAGVLDLNRITVGNIRKIEIVKGPSSSLYGSEALAGVINIITDRSYEEKYSAAVRYGTYNTLDANLSASKRMGKFGFNAFLNSYSTDGYSIRPYSVERSRLPIWRLTPQVKFNYTIGPKTSLTISARYNYEYIRNEISVANNGQIVSSKGREINKDWNIIPTLVHQFSNKLKTSFRLYGTQFEGSQQLATTSGGGYDDYFRQQLYRIENQTDYTILPDLSVVAGAGYLKELVYSSRYDDKSSRKDNDIKYGFVQTEWKPFNALTLIGGMRYDDNKLYASAFSPKIAAQLLILPSLRLQASFGKGFKAPDFRQLYLNFTNTAAGGYSVYGTLEAQRVIAVQQLAGMIAELNPDYYKLQTLCPEFSNGFNAGLQFNPKPEFSAQLNVFRNDITDLIESRQVATRVDNSQIFSYINVKEAYTQGVETNIKWQLIPSVTIEGGYQLLLTADKNEKAKIEAGNYYFTRDANGYSIPVKKSDYIGLPNRSKHMGNLKLTYENKKHNWFASVRNIYRSKWVVFDKDGNGIYNKQDGFADGFVMVNLSAGKEFGNGIRVCAGIDNLTNHVDANNLPNMPGRTFYGSINYTFSKNSKQSKN